MAKPLAPETFIQKLWYGLYRSLGWRLEGHLPDTPKYVIIVAHHTSNWDFPIGFIASRSVPLGFPYWIAKHTLFRWPIGGLLRKLGGIPINRSAPGDFIQQVVKELDQHTHFIVALTPEGTRSKTDYWKSGFYYLALGAKVPISCAYIDYRRKAIGLGPLIVPTGDIHNDFAPIQKFYAQVTGKYPEQQGEVCIRPRTAESK